MENVAKPFLVYLMEKWQMYTLDYSAKFIEDRTNVWVIAVFLLQVYALKPVS